MSPIRWLTVNPAATGSLKPYLGEAGIAIAFSAPSEQAALRLGRLHRLPAAIKIISVAEYKFYRQKRLALAWWRESEVAARTADPAHGSRR